MNTITLYRTPQGFMAQFSDPAIKRDFGTDVLPTAFTANANPERVRAQIQALNPNARVEVVT